MAEIINSSFIPKKEFKKDSGRRRGPQLNIFFLISLVIFLTTIIITIGVYLWKMDLEKTNEQSKKNFASKREDYGIKSIEELAELSNRIDASKTLLSTHYNVAPIFTFLEKNTLTDVRLTNFSMIEKDDKIIVESKGQASDLTDLQLQSRAYASNPNIDNLILSNINKSKEGFSIFDLDFTVDKEFLTSREFIIKNN